MDLKRFLVLKDLEALGYIVSVPIVLTILVNMFDTGIDRGIAIGCGTLIILSVAYVYNQWQQNVTAKLENVTEEIEKQQDEFASALSANDDYISELEGAASNAVGILDEYERYKALGGVAEIEQNLKKSQQTISEFNNQIILLQKERTLLQETNKVLQLDKDVLQGENKVLHAKRSVLQKNISRYKDLARGLQDEVNIRRAKSRARKGKILNMKAS